MALEFTHGEVQWNSADAAGTNYTVSGLAFQPKGIRFYCQGLGSAVDTSSQTVHLRQSVGVATSPTDRRSVAVVHADNAADSFDGSMCRNDAVICTLSALATPAVDGLLDLTAINSDGFTLTVDDAAPANLTVFWEAWGGSDITVAQTLEISEPAAIGNVDYAVTGFTAGATDQVVMLAGCQATVVNTATNTDSGMCVGFAAGTAVGDNVVIAMNSDDASAAMDTQNYSQDGECLAMIVVAGGNPTARATLTQFGANNFRLNWLSRALTNRKYIALAMKGGQWKVGTVTINTTVLNNTATVSGLPFQPVGICTLDTGGVEATAATSTTPGRFCLGTGTSTTSRRAMGMSLNNGGATSNVNLALEYDQVHVKPTSTGGVGVSIDINSINADGFQLITDVVGSDASEWLGYLAFGDAASTAADLVVANGAQAQTSDNVALTQEHVLAVAGGTQAQTAGNIVLTQESTLALANGAHAQASDNLTLTESTNLTVAGATQAQTSDNIALTQVHNLTVAAGSHAQSSDNIALTQVHSLTVAEAAQAQTSGNVVLTQVHALTVAGATHAQSADNLALTQLHVLSVAAGTHAQTADNISLTQLHQLALADALHAQTAGNVPLEQTHALTIADASHDQSAGNVTLSLAGTLELENAQHAHTADNVSLVQAHQLAVAGGTHAQSAQSSDLVQIHYLSISDTIQSQSAQNLTLEQQFNLNVHNATHGGGATGGTQLIISVLE